MPVYNQSSSANEAKYDKVSSPSVVGAAADAFSLKSETSLPQLAGTTSSSLSSTTGAVRGADLPNTRFNLALSCSYDLKFFGASNSASE